MTPPTGIPNSWNHTRNVLQVYRRSGNAEDDGFLSNPDLSSAIIQGFREGGQTYVDMYEAINLELGQHYQNLWTTPRQIRFGLRLEF